MRRVIPVVMAALVLAPLSAVPATAGSKPRKTKEEEASAFERYLAARPGVPEARERRVFVQPLNKTEPCKLPSSPDQVRRPHFRAFWDGACRNGFAYGLGRDIAISDTHHIEEISVHDGTGENWTGPHVVYDYTGKSVMHVIGGASYPAAVLYRESMETGASGFNQVNQLMVQDNLGNRWAMVSSPFNPERRLLATEGYGAVGYAIIDTRSAPVVNPENPNLVYAVTDPRGMTSDAVTVARYPEGGVGHFMRRAGQLEPVTLPKSYTAHLQAKFDSLQRMLEWGRGYLAPAAAMEREYLQKACQGSAGVKGLAPAQYRKICSWRDQFQPAYAAAQANYQRQLAVLNQQAEVAGQQRLAAAQMRLQAAVAAQQASAQRDLASAVQGLSSTIQTMQTQSTLNGLMSFRAPEVAPLRSPMNNLHVCRQVGPLFSCTN
ncbi:hypothetical protein [Novosphingobium soli]|uniref:Uncharacterized protein n=1 Tax=Novosphingobium soli TaxID=574956 RepID=A0ABV6CRW5_9SPHN